MQQNYINQNLEKTLKKTINEFNELKYSDNKFLKKTIKFWLNNIRTRFEVVTNYGCKSKIDNWIYCNYYIVEKQAKHLLKSINKIYLPIDNKYNLPDIYVYIRQCMFDEYFEFNTKSVIELIDLFEMKRYLTNFEMDFIEYSIRISSIELIYNLLKSDKEDKVDKFMCKAIGLLNNVANVDFFGVNKNKNQLDKILQQDPSGYYRKMNEKTKQIYRYKTSKIALNTNVCELELAKNYIEKSKIKQNKHIGEYIYKDYNQKIKPNLNKKIYIPLLFICPLIVGLILSLLLRNILVLPICYFPLFEILKPLIEFVCTRKIETEYAPRLELNNEIPNGCETLIVISTLLPKVKQLKDFKNKLEKLYLTNCNGEVKICILADLPQGKYPVLSQDKAIIKANENLIYKLNKQYDDKFILFVRNRSYSKTQNIYSGYDRKRGAITELIRFIKDENVELASFVGDIKFIKSVKYILTLDSDTQALMDSAVQLVSIAKHPLNKPFVKNGAVKKGYGVIVPRMSIDLKNSLKTPFSKVMAGLGGVSAYDKSCGDIYQDLYEQGIFAGKGLIDVDIFHEILDNVFIDETVLSHDILEGNFARALFVSDVELLDGFPNGATPYFKRLHRWIRGDFQNINYLKRKIKTPKGIILNPINRLSKFKLFDNLRRSLTPFFNILLIIISAFVSFKLSVILFCIGILSVIMPYLFGVLYNIFTGKIFNISRKYYSKTMPYILELINKIVYNIIFWPQFVFIGLDASIRAIYRKYISNKNLLEWSTAAQVENSKSNFVQTLRFYWLSVVLGIILLISQYYYIKILGLIFLLNIPLVLFSKKEYENKTTYISKNNKQELIGYTEKMWQYYVDYANEKENYLPPDNVSQAPTYKIAHRTSPTNIGMMLISILSARDFDFIDSKEMHKMINNTITTVEKMEKWNGNLYNWYDTRTLALMQPFYVSAVDSGNFVCCLIALKEGLREYVFECENLNEIIVRIENIVNQTNIGAFYDKTAKLLSIGYEQSEGKLSKSHYDLLMSEARMTSYFAVAKRQVPKIHWEALGRTLTMSNNYAGPVSWTGTMFEYFMPELFLHSIQGSLSYEGLRYCLYCQKQRAKQRGIPYGISESCYYVFDNQLNYQYKAHGVQKLALKRDLNKDLVVSPYSTFLTLSYDMDSGLKNLRWLNELGVNGKYGHFEAVDFTPSRVLDNGFEIIKSYMAHHIGMSIVGVSNTLMDNIMQKRFLKDKQMESASELLQEKVMVGEVVFEDIYKKEKVSKEIDKDKQLEKFYKTFPQQPRVKVLSNKEITSVLTDVGIGYCTYQNKDLTRKTKDLLKRPNSIYVFGECNDEVTSFTNAPNYDNQVEREVVFEDNSVSYLTNLGEYEFGMKVTVDSNLPCEHHEIVFKNNSNSKKKMKGLVYLEPNLSNYKDDIAHLAFSKLFVHISYDKASNVLLAKRKTRNDEQAPYLAVGFKQDINFEFETKRENLMERPYGITSIKNNFNNDFTRGIGTPDPCMAIRFTTDVSANSQSQYNLIISAGNSQEEAINNIIDIRNGKQNSYNHNVIDSLGYNTIEGKISSMILPQILYNKKDSKENLEAVKQNDLSPNNLWQLGISGDYPIVLIDLDNHLDEQRIKSYILVQSRLRLCGINYDTVFLYKEGGDYNSPIKNGIIDNVKQISEESIIGTNCGVHLINKNLCNEQIEILLKAIACHISPKSLFRLDIPVNVFNPIKIQPVNKQNINIQNSYKVIDGEFKDESFYITGNPKLPWCHILSNNNFGTLVSDKSLGFTWAINSRENKITPWENDTMTDNLGEQLILKVGDEFYNLVNGALPEFNPDFASYYGQIDNIKTNVKITVPKKGMMKYIEIELENTGESDMEIDTAYYFEPCLNVTRENSRQIKGAFEDNILYMNNSFNQVVKSHIGVTSNHKFDYVCDRTDFWNWKINNSLPPVSDICGSLIIKKQLPAKTKLNIKYIMAFSTSKQGVKSLLEQKPKQKISSKNKIKINTPDKDLNYMINTWLPWQTLSSRIYGRTGFYQCGGAYGFRDQLQDMLATMYLDVSIARSHIIRACNSQFEQGDVLHWWHNLPPTKKGVRTRYSDDLLWLPYVVCEYIEKTNDYSVLDVPVKYIVAPELSENEHEKYVEVSYTDYAETVYEHCKKAIEKGHNLGDSGLVLIGCGDWNDGYNNVGVEGKGESVWLSQFLAMVMEKFSKIVKYKNDSGLIELYNQKRQSLLENIDKYCWDGNWYIRAFFDNGQKMGSSQGSECFIDSLPQSFSVLSKMENKDRIRIALNSAYENLVDKQNKLIKLFTPSYDKSEQQPGYVKSYPIGVRENGGQYTHGAVWLALALLEFGEIERGYELIKILNPVTKYKDEDIAKKYMTEPYYMVADIYTNPSAYGRGGWSMYTGAASWYYKTVLESLLGIKILYNKLYINPRLPQEWQGYTAEIEYNNTKINFQIKNCELPNLFVNGKQQDFVDLDGKYYEVILK